MYIHQYKYNRGGNMNSMRYEFTPAQIVDELDKYIIGQKEAKRAVAVAVRNRWRRQHVEGKIKDDILPANILMIGPTGVGKTEIARRLAKLVKAPFVKVEASKFTEVGYVGRDVDSMIRDLVHISVNMVKDEVAKRKKDQIEEIVEEKILDILLPFNKGPFSSGPDESYSSAREKLREELKSGKLEDREIEIDVPSKKAPFVEVMGDPSLGISIQDMISSIIPGPKNKRRVKIKEARKILIAQEEEKLINKEDVIEEALERAQSRGIVFIDEIDKIAISSRGAGPDVSRTGVQRDLLPIVEGTNVVTKYGVVKTDHILFIAAGAFHVAKPSDLLPELQGRFPIRVELSSLKQEDFVRILVEPENALVKQYKALLGVEGLDLEFTDDAIEKISYYAYLINQQEDDIGARRLHTVMSYLLEELMFIASDMEGQKVVINGEEVDRRLAGLSKDKDLRRYIL